MHYRWHPQAGQAVRILYREQRGVAGYVCERVDGTYGFQPEWMFDAATCQRFIAGPPAVSLRAMHDLRRLLTAVPKCGGGSSDEGGIPVDEGTTSRETEADEAGVLRRVGSATGVRHPYRPGTPALGPSDCGGEVPA